MADDILGHEHLDHGAHLHHHPIRWAPGARLNRGSRPKHIALGGDPHAHLHQVTPAHPYQDPHAHLHAHGAAHGSGGHHGHTAHGHDHGHSHGAAFDARRTLIWGLAFCLSIPILLLFHRSYPALAAVLIIISVNSLIEYHKFFTEGMPIDLEILFLGAAYVTVLYGVGWGLAVAAFGPVTAAAVRARVNDVVVRKTFAVFVVVLAASVLSPTRWEIAFAVLLGVASHYAIVVITGHSQGVSTIITRITDLGMNVYLALFLLPLITTIA